MTPEQIQEMRVAIAEKCGWVQIEDQLIMFDGWELRGVCPKERVRMRVPNYPADLNAMHEAEKVITAEHWDRYAQWLRELTRSNRRFLIAHATALQRAEAFCRTLKIGPFKEEIR